MQHNISDKDLEALVTESFHNAQDNDYFKDDTSSADIAVDMVAYDSEIGSIEVVDGEDYEDLIQRIETIIDKLKEA